MIRFCEINPEVLESTDIQDDYIVLNKFVWEKGRKYFNKYNEKERVLVVDRDFHPIYFAYQDNEANREIRMLRELEEIEDALNFHDIYPDVCGVTIYGCNELAWYFAKYLLRRGIAVNVVGEIWSEVDISKDCDISHCNYEIWAEGIHQKYCDFNREQMRSASVEFECINEIYEANIKAGKIGDVSNNIQMLLSRLRKEKEIVIRGTGTKAQDAFDWLCDNGIDICAFQSDRDNGGRKSLFGKPILRKKEVRRRFQNAIILECSSKHSAWGFGDVDAYDYEGYERNKKYILLRDYIEVPENNLVHILKGKNLIFIGDIYLCNRAYKWWENHGIEIENIKYWDIFVENKADQFEIETVDKTGVLENAVLLLMLPNYSNINFMTKEAAGQFAKYVAKLKEYEIYDYTDYFVDVNKCIHLEDERIKYNIKELCPSGILLGAIPAHSGNILIRQSLEGHPQVVMIEEYGFFNNDLYFICIRLAEMKACDILRQFWILYENEVKKDGILSFFVNREKFDCKMQELLRLQENFTSQELFVMFHLAYAAMYNREIHYLDGIIIYWEPHRWKRTLVRELAYWLGSSEVKGVTLSTVRNRYILSGSYIKDAIASGGTADSWMHVCEYIPKRRYPYWEEHTVKFEELKCAPKETLNMLCDWMGISFDDILMETTYHGEKASYDGIITGFDTAPAYNLYEEYFSSFDRMRISILAGSFQKQYGYPYVNCLQFSRRELQELLLKEFHYEQKAGIPRWGNRTEDSFRRIQKRFRYLLWLHRFSEIMEIDLDEEF